MFLHEKKKNPSLKCLRCNSASWISFTMHRSMNYLASCSPSTLLILQTNGAFWQKVLKENLNAPILAKATLADLLRLLRDAFLVDGPKISCFRQNYRKII